MILVNAENIVLRASYPFRALPHLITAYFGQMRYRVNGENIVVRASCPLRAVLYGQRKALYIKSG